MSTSHICTYMFGGFSVVRLRADYYKLHETACVICYSDESSDCGLEEASPIVPDIDSDLRSISPISTVKTLACQHVFHERCIVKWLEDQTSRDLHGSCPMCRRKLIYNPTATAPEPVASERIAIQQRIRELDEAMFQLLVEYVAWLKEELHQLEITLEAVLLCQEERASTRAELATEKRDGEAGGTGGAEASS